MLFIGWDVGGWNCDTNANSRDALVVLDEQLNLLGTPWRGNLRALINEAQTTQEWLNGLLNLCQVSPPPNKALKAVLAIDTPLGFAEAFTALVTQREQGVYTAPIEHSASNPYLFRLTERVLFERGLKPLSAVKDMLGSQATKGMHVLAKFAPKVHQPGVWSDLWNEPGEQLLAFEGYPSACKKSMLLQGLVSKYPVLTPTDKQDALLCALLASVWANTPTALFNPLPETPTNEGWIWVPEDSLKAALVG
jgi:hypothetical protein